MWRFGQLVLLACIWGIGERGPMSPGDLLFWRIGGNHEFVFEIGLAESARQMSTVARGWLETVGSNG
jgi:hypothetical protein